MFHQVPQFSLDDLEYAFEFSEKEQVLLQRAFDNQEKGGVFHVLKQTGPSGQGGRSQLSKFDEVHRPDRIFPHPRRHHPTVQALSISRLDSTRPIKGLMSYLPGHQYPNPVLAGAIG